MSVTTLRLVGTALELTAISSLVLDRLLELRDRRLEQNSDRWLMEASGAGEPGKVVDRVAGILRDRSFNAIPEWLIPLEGLAIVVGITLTTWSWEISTLSLDLPPDGTDRGRALAACGQVLAMATVLLYLHLRRMEGQISFLLSEAEGSDQGSPTVDDISSEASQLMSFAGRMHDSWAFQTRFLTFVLLPVTIVFLTWPGDVADAL